MKKVREYVEFLIMLYDYRDEMVDLIKILEVIGKEFDMLYELIDDDDDGNDGVEESDFDDENGIIIY